MHGLKVYICDSNVPMESLIASFFRFCRRQDADSKFWILWDASISKSLEFASRRFSRPLWVLIVRKWGHFVLKSMQKEFMKEI